MAAQSKSYSIARDLAQVTEVVEHCEIITEITRLGYYLYLKVVLFTCDRYHVNNHNSGSNLMSMDSLL